MYLQLISRLLRRFVGVGLNPPLQISIVILFTACADSRGKKAYIDSLENERYQKSITQSYQPGNLVQLIDQNSTLRSVALKDIDGDGIADGIDLNGDGNLDIRLLAGNETRVSPWAFITPIDIDNNGGADYFLYFTIVNNVVQIRFITANNSNALPLVFLINVSNQITGLDNTGDAVSDDARLNGTMVVAAGSPADSTPPSQPGTPGGASGGTTQIDLSWTAATDNSSSAANISYEICQSTTAGGCSTFTATYSVPAGQTNYSATGLTALTTYYYRIRSRDASGNYGTPSGEFSATTAALGTVNNPTYLPVAGIFGSAQNVAISTTTPAASICYSVDGVTTPACDAAALCSAGATYFSAVNVSTITNLQAIACKLGNTASAVVSGTFTIDMAGPSTPGSFAATPAGTTQADLSWNASTDNFTAQANIVYEICQTTTSGACSPFAVSYTTAAGATNYSATGLNALTTYYFVIRAKDSVNNNGTATGEVSTTTNAIGTVVDPTYTPTAGTYGLAQNVSMSSITPSATICYTTDGVTTPVCDAAATCTTGSTYGSAINTTVTTTYRAVGCKVGYTASNVATGVFTIDTTPPVPGNSGTLTTSGITTSSITVDWIAATDNVTAQASLEYLLYYSLANNLGSVSAIETNGTAVGTYATNIATQTATGLSSGTTYYFAVIVRDGLGNKASYGVVSGVTSAVNGFVYVANYGSNDVSMYTINASTGELTAMAPATIAAGIGPQSVIVDPTGRFAYVANETSNNVSMYAINAGTGALTANGTISAGNPESVTVDPSGRFVYVVDFSSNNVSMYTINAGTGALTANGTIPTGSNPDSVTVDPSGRFAYVANAGGNNVSMYTIDTSTGVLTSNGTIAAGTNPISVTVDPRGRFAYVANYGSANVSMYTINAATGALSANGSVASPNLPRSVIVDPRGRFAYIADENLFRVLTYSIDAATGTLTYISGGAGSSTGSGPCSVTVDPSGRFAYVANNGSNDVSMHTIDASTGALSWLGSVLVAAGTNPRSVVAVRAPVPRFAYVANRGSANVSMYAINPSTGALTANGTIAAGTNPESVTVDKSGRFAYVANVSSSNVSMYTINPTTGALTANGAIAAGSSSRSVTVDNSGRFAYVANVTNNNVSMYTINTSTGALTDNGTIAAGTFPYSVTTDPSGRFAYVANNGSNNVSMYTINASTGALSSIGTIGAGTGALPVTVDPSGRFAYVANRTGNNVSMYTINPSTGVLTANGTIATGTAPWSVLVHPSGRFAYVVNNTSANVSMYTINASTGVFTANGTIAAGTNAISVTIDQGGRFAYVANSTSNNVSMYTINASTGTLTAIGTIAAGNSPYSVTAW